MGRRVSRTRVAVLDYGSGNLRSAQRALERVGAQVEVTADPELVMAADGLVVPGVGAYASCMAGLRAVDAPRLIDRRLAGGRPVLGICVGMQVMFERGVEHGVLTEGLGQWPGSIERLEAPILPHMGWNTVEAPESSVMFSGLHEERFYFVHSYAARTWTLTDTDPLPEPVVTWTTYGEPFVAAVENGALWATQFHPEKSGDAGSHLLRSWIQTL